jgi:hypothetical protein
MIQDRRKRKWKRGQRSGGKGCGLSSKRTLAAASMTVEAALALPLFFLCLVSLIALSDLYSNYAAEAAELQQKAETQARQVSTFMEGDSAGSGVVDLPKTVRYRPLALPFPVNELRFACRGRVRAWIGYRPEEDAEQETDETVFVTKNQSVYHTSSSCSHLKLSWEGVPSSSLAGLRNQKGARYHACEKCAAGGNPSPIVWLSPQGDAYHNSAVCSGLTRHIRIVKKSEVQSLHECSRCMERRQKEAAQRKNRRRQRRETEIEGSGVEKQKSKEAA